MLKGLRPAMGDMPVGVLAALLAPTDSGEKAPRALGLLSMGEPDSLRPLGEPAAVRRGSRR